MDLKERNEVSKAFVNLQNEIARMFKRLVIAVWDAVHDLDELIFIFRQLNEQFEKQDHVSGQHVLDDLFPDIFEDIADYDPPEYVEWDYYRSFMHSQIMWDESVYRELDDKWEYFYEYGFTFQTFASAFEDLLGLALKQFITGKNIRDKVAKQLSIIRITDQYDHNRIKLTLRQLYYQLVSQNIIANSEAEYKKIIDLTGNMRENCVLEMDEFADNTRFAILYNYETDPLDFLTSQVNPNRYYRNSREGQPHYIEVWIEKEALRTVVKPITDQYDVPLFICRGYPSTSSLYDQARRLMQKTEAHDGNSVREMTILYFGDHDPSGLQIPEAIAEILHKYYQLNHVNVVQCGLRREHIMRFNLPPNPAKITDPRAQQYMRRHGEVSWELDALPPTELQNIIREEILKRTDMDKVHDSRSRTIREREKIERLVALIPEMWSSLE